MISKSRAYDIVVTLIIAGIVGGMGYYIYINHVNNHRFSRAKSVARTCLVHQKSITLEDPGVTYEGRFVCGERSNAVTVTYPDYHNNTQTVKKIDLNKMTAAKGFIKGLLKPDNKHKVEE